MGWFHDTANIFDAAQSYNKRWFKWYHNIKISKVHLVLSFSLFRKDNYLQSKVQIPW